MSKHIGTLTVPVHINGTRVTTVLNGETLQLGTLDHAHPNKQELTVIQHEIAHHLNNGDSPLNFNVTITIEHG